MDYCKRQKKDKKCNKPEADLFTCKQTKHTSLWSCNIINAKTSQFCTKSIFVLKVIVIGVASTQSMF